MLNSQNLINKICACISGGGLTALQSCQLTGALNVLCQPVCSVVCCNNLPDATTYVGRMIYVQAENRYYYSFNGLWLNDFQSTIYNYEDSLWTWGMNNNGQLGDNTTTSRSSPVSVVGGITNWCQVSAAGFATGGHTVALRSSGNAWAWGANAGGQLGNNTATETPSPVSVVGGFSDWCNISAGCTHTLAIRSSGSAWAWGRSNCGQLGDNTTTSRSSPVSVVGGFTDWCQISAGFNNSIAVRTSGSAWAWGQNNYGRLGDNTVTTRLSPVSVVGGFTNWCQASAGTNHSMAVRSSGSVWAWGLNSSGQLGDTTTTSKLSPVSVVGGFTDWCQASAGGHSVAVRISGSAWAWGSNSFGQLGDNTTTTRLSPVSVVGGFTNWCGVSASNHTMGVRLNGTAWSWGRNNCGQLGDNTTTNRTSPVSVVGGFTDWSQVGAAYSHTIGLRQEVKGF